MYSYLFILCVNILHHCSTSIFHIKLSSQPLHYFTSIFNVKVSFYVNIPRHSFTSISLQIFHVNISRSYLTLSFYLTTLCLFIQPLIKDMMPVVKKKRDRFKGLSEEQVLLRRLPDLMVPGLDIIIVSYIHT